jgi:O-antigen ligase
MSFVRALSESEVKRLQSIILFGGAFTTLAVWTNLEDPINLPKMFVLALFSSAVFGLSLSSLISVKKKAAGSQKICLGLIGIFLLGLLIATLKTDVKYTAIFGEYRRNNGALAYLAMSALMLGSIFAFNLRSTKRYLYFFSGTGITVTVYGVLQGVDKDPVSWSIQYNPFVTTLGNPNFTSAFLGLSGIAIFLSTLNSKKNNLKALFLVGLLLNIFVLVKAGSIQGIFGFLIGVTIIVLTKIWIANKRSGQVGALVIGIMSIPVLLALINIGPLASRIYQGTLKNRYDYWSAAFAMFKDHPIFGVGTDRFGEFYREYALQNQVVQGQMTDNAHSIYMQLLATGGLITFIPYVLLVVCITLIGVKALFNAERDSKLLISGVFGIWLATISINLVTVDNLGVGVWFWITGGVLIAIAKGEDEQSADIKRPTKLKRKSDTEAFPVGYFAAAILLIFSLILLVPQLNKSSSLLTLKKTLPGLSSQEYIAKVIKAFDPEEKNTQYLIQLSDLAFRQGAIVDGLKMVDRINEVDQRSYYGNYFAAVVNESIGKQAEAIEFRERLKILDPWNNANLIELAKNYLAVGNKDSAAAIVGLIKKNYPGSQADIDASALLVG